MGIAHPRPANNIVNIHNTIRCAKTLARAIVQSGKRTAQRHAVEKGQDHNIDIIILYCSCYIIITANTESFISYGAVRQSHAHTVFYTITRAICLSRVASASVGSLYV